MSPLSRGSVNVLHNKQDDADVFFHRFFFLCSRRDGVFFCYSPLSFFFGALMAAVDDERRGCVVLRLLVLCVLSVFHLQLRRRMHVHKHTRTSASSKLSARQRWRQSKECGGRKGTDLLFPRHTRCKKKKNYRCSTPYFIPLPPPFPTLCIVMARAYGCGEVLL
jgi:hypothetical protein